jgi:hypothetical protein
VGPSGEEKNSQHLPGLEPPIIQRLAQRYATELSRLKETRNTNENIRLNFRLFNDAVSTGYMCRMERNGKTVLNNDYIRIYKKGFVDCLEVLSPLSLEETGKTTKDFGYDSW